MRTTAAPVAPAKLRPDTPPVTEQELATAIGERQLEIHYQPQISIANRAFVGVEALVRWRHPTRGLVYPNDFIPLAERSGLIDALSWVTYEQSMSDLRALCETCGPLHLSLNLSACSLHDLATPERLVELAARTGLPVSQLVVEITESSLMSELSSALDVLTRIRLRGIALSIDDFGTGYSMMDQLRRVPASELKIDRSFITDATHDERALVIVEKTIEIGRRLQMRVVAEGVETTEQAGMLRALGCEMAQGYLFSRPVPLAALRTWASAWPAAGRAA